MKFQRILLIIFINMACLELAMAYDVDEVDRLTNGRGVFTVTVENVGDAQINALVSVVLLGHVVGHENETPLPSYSSSQRLKVEARSSTSIRLIKPLIGSWPDFIGDGPDLTEGSKVLVSLGPMIMGNYAYYPIKYVPDTKFLDVPNTTFTIGKKR